MDLASALKEAEVTAAKPAIKCRLCDFLDTLTDEDRAAQKQADLRAKKGDLPKYIVLDALSRAGFEVGHSTYNRHLKHVDSDAS